MLEPVEISTLAKIVTGKTPPTKIKEYFDGEFPFITPSDIPTFHEKHLPFTERTLSEKGKKYQKQLLIPKESVCYVSIGSTIGKICKTFTDSFTNQQIHSLIPYPDKADADFLYYLLRSVTPYIQLVGDGKGSGKPIINKTEFSRIKVTVPDVSVQKIIAPILSTYDAAIENNIKRIKLLEQTARELYKEWFVRMRFPDYKKTRFKKGIPDKWRIEKVKSIVNRHKFGRTYRPEELIETGNVIVIDQSTKALLGYHNNEPDNKSSSGKPMIIFGDHTCKMQLMVEDFSLAENVIPVSSKNNIPIYFLYYLIESLVETTEYKRHWNDLVTKPVLIPIDDLQKRYSDIVKPFFEQINILIKQNTELRKIRDRLLPRLISGKLQVKVDSKRQNSVIV
jgi:type I restriction enzyme S subunit